MSLTLILFLSFLTVIKPILNAVFNSFEVRGSRRDGKTLIYGSAK